MAMRTSVRRTTASSQTTRTTRTTCSSPSTTPMTTLTHCTCTSTDARRTCTETAPHLMAQVLSAFTLPSAWSSMAHSLWLDFSLFFYLFLLSIPVFLFHLELFLALHYTIVMANLRCSAAEESEDTLNSFTSPTGDGRIRTPRQKPQLKGSVNANERWQL